MRRWALFVLLGVALADDDRFAKDIGNPALGRSINDAIAKGVAYLKAIQREDGRWTPAAGDDRTQSPGMTALSLYALAASGVPRDDPAIVRGLDFVSLRRSAFREGAEYATYSNALLVLAFTRIDPVAFRPQIHEAADRLVEGQTSYGMWSYTLGPAQAPARAGDRAAWRRSINRRVDNSNTQFAVLALWAAQELAGYEVEPTAWLRVRDHYLGSQRKNGGWGYGRSDRSARGTMTAAGIVSLAYALTALDDKDGALERAREHRAVQRGLACLNVGAALDAFRYNYYGIYSLERVGTVLELDIRSWYVPGANWLVEIQRPDGSWGGYGEPKGKALQFQYPYETSLALLFLTRATRHVVTTRTGLRPEGPVTKKDTGPDTPEGLFDLYVATRPEEREALVPRLAKREVVGLCVARLRESRQPVREAAYELLSRLVAKPFLFDPAAGPEERDVMLGPIEAFWKEKGEALEWDETRARFVPK